MALPVEFEAAGLVAPLGLDTFAVSVGLGLRGFDLGRRLRYAASFALAEGTMPIVGFLVGRTVTGAIGRIAPFIAAAILLAAGIFAIVHREEENAPGEDTILSLAGMALAVSMDELAIGLSFGLLHIPIAVAIALIVAQAIGISLLGTALGARLGERVAERAELLSGVVLCGLAVFVAAEPFIGA